MFHESKLEGEVFLFPRLKILQKLPSSFGNEVFIDRVPEEVSCGICSKVNMKPLFCTQCSTSFCKKCIDKARGYTKVILNTSDMTCPSCYKKSIKQSSKTFRKRIGNLLIKCQRCPETMPLHEVKAHREVCPNSQIMCSNTGCGAKGSRKDFFSFLYTPPWIDSDDFQTEYLTCSEKCKLILEFNICLVDDKPRALELYRTLLLAQHV